MKGGEGTKVVRETGIWEEDVQGAFGLQDWLREVGSVWGGERL